MITPFMIRSTLGAVLCVSLLPSLAQAEEIGEFQEVLALAELDPNAWPAVGAESLDPAVLELLQQLLFRLREFPEQQLIDWSNHDFETARRGTLLSAKGIIEEVAPIMDSQTSSTSTNNPRLYRCRYHLDESNVTGYVLTPRIPSLWNKRTVAGEPVRIVAIVLQPKENDNSGPLLLTNRLGWYPTSNVSSGMLLLSSQGMDVSLLDEVRHRQPFVKATVSREGDAFYECLSAISSVDRDELAELVLDNIRIDAENWTAEIPALEEQVRKLKTEPTASVQQTKALRQRLALATAVRKRAAEELSSVAPLFLQPEQETGELVRIAGIARRVVRIAANHEDLEAYYEIEVFPSDSQNLPIVCCVTSLPPEFPQGDEIRENVRVDGVFFKSWRFRTRKTLEESGKTTSPQQLYTPLIVGREPIWLKAQVVQTSNWTIVAGFCFFVLIVGAFVALVIATGVERQRRNSLNPTQLKGDLAGPSPQEDSNRVEMKSE